MEGAIVSHNWAHDSPKAGFRFDSSPGWVMMIIMIMMMTKMRMTMMMMMMTAVQEGWGEGVIRATMWLGTLALVSW